MAQPISAKTAAPAPIKQFEVFKPGKFNSKELEIRQNGSTILQTSKTKQIFKPPQVDILTNDKKPLASVRLQTWSRDMYLHLGNPDCTDKAQWADLSKDNFRGNRYKFFYNGRAFLWKKTHNNDLGSGFFGARDFKLVDEQTDQVLMVYLHNQAMFKHGIMAHINFYTELDQQLELLSIAGIFGIQEIVTRSQNSSAAAGGGGGGGGA